jgi:hypothetical protein
MFKYYRHHPGNKKYVALCGIDSYSTDAKHVDCKDCLKLIIEALPNGPWEMFAHKRKNGSFNDIGTEFYCRIHDEKEKIYKVLVEKDNNGEYWGWQDPDDKEPHMIWSSEACFSMCFGSGYKAMVENFRGRVLKLKITER